MLMFIFGVGGGGGGNLGPYHIESFIHILQKCENECYILK